MDGSRHHRDNATHVNAVGARTVGNRPESDCNRVPILDTMHCVRSETSLRPTKFRALSPASRGTALILSRTKPEPATPQPHIVPWRRCTHRHDRNGQHMRGGESADRRVTYRHAENAPVGNIRIMCGSLWQ